MHKLTGGLFLLVMFLSLDVFAQQESLFSQYMFNPFVINPAYAGSSKSLHLTASARKQWLGMDGAPSTQTISAHAPLMAEKIGVGLIGINDNIGITSQQGFFLAYAYKISFSSTQILSMGLQAGATYYKSAFSKLDTRQDNDPSFVADMATGFIPSFGTGLYYETSRIYAGVSLPHLVNNIFRNEAVATNLFQRRHVIFTGGGVFTASPSLKIKPSMLLKAASGIPMQIDLNLNTLFKEVLWLGGSYRTNNICNLLIQIQATNQLRLGYAYDFYISRAMNIGRGSHEIILNYNFSFVKSRMVTPRYF